MSGETVLTAKDQGVDIKKTVCCHFSQQHCKFDTLPLTNPVRVRGGLRIAHPELLPPSQVDTIRVHHLYCMRPREEAQVVG